MPSTILFVTATLLLSLNLVRPFGLAVSDWLYFGALGFGLVETFLIERRHAICWWHNRLLWAIALILIGALISTMNSREWGVALIEIFQQIFVMTLFISLIRIMVRRGKTAPIMLAFILSGVFTAVIVLIDYVTGSRFGPALSGTPDLQLWGRFAGTLGHPNKLGYFLVLTTLFSVGQLFNIKLHRFISPSQLLWSVLIVVQVVGIYLTGSMTAYLGLALGSIIIAFSSKAIFFRITRALGILIAAVLLLAIFQMEFRAILPGNKTRFESTSIAQAFHRIKTITADSRLKNYSQAWDRITCNLWVGAGYDQISTSGVSSLSRLLDVSVHNTLLQIWYTGGIFAFIGWLAIYILVGWTALSVVTGRGLHSIPSSLALSLAAAALAALLMDQFQDAIYQREKWLVIGLVLSYAWEHIAIGTVRQNRSDKPETDLLTSGQGLIRPEYSSIISTRQGQ